MKEQFAEKIIGRPLMMDSHETTPERQYPSLSEPVSLLQTPSSSSHASPTSSKTTAKGDSKIGHMKKLGRKSSTYAYRIRDHVMLGPKLRETVKGKLRLGARIIREGGRENIFKHIFGVSEGEKLLKASQCYLSTTAGPLAGLLFISSQKVAFCSETSLAYHSPDGQFITAPYKVVIPIRKIKRANQSQNVNNPAQKYMEIVTTDNFEFWFMGFLRYEKALMNLEKAISMTYLNLV